ncbi:hypothetical protein VC218_11505 [Xanthomonas nasturtii]|uniref:hypothetical protein n=1 Tax=Xanthomonas nasturtii TaxID=1843581 RepID=UPI002B23ACB6|nr:hypothetical protein [Xanthomonas nasturtii]MEA9579512.1 hypothetical protein [Xanthomonas nasturtii]
MPYLFLAVVAIAIVAFASPASSVSFFLLAAAIPTTVKLTAQWLVGLEFSFGQATKAVAYSFGLSLFFVLVLISAGHGSVTLGPALIASLAACYVLGFKWALGTSFGPSCVIAAVSTVVSVALIAIVRFAL